MLTIPRISIAQLVSIASLVGVLASPVSAQPSDAMQQKSIRSLISKTFDQPSLKVDTGPIAIVQDFAIADWIQGEKGGRALLRQQHGKWEIIACGGDGFKEVKALKDAGIDIATAQSLITQLNDAEKNLNADRVKRFGLFGMTGESQHTNHPANLQH
ncbi:MAG: copper uptake system-associated protein [Rhodocyclaceae bacterium]|nr:copper uptake system-associated protein [Rhodocyclaceae bacterium]